MTFTIEFVFFKPRCLSCLYKFPIRVSQFAKICIHAKEELDEKLFDLFFSKKRFIPQPRIQHDCNLLMANEKTSKHTHIYTHSHEEHIDI